MYLIPFVSFVVSFAEFAWLLNKQLQKIKHICTITGMQLAIMRIRRGWRAVTNTNELPNSYVRKVIAIVVKSSQLQMYIQHNIISN